MGKVIEVFLESATGIKVGVVGLQGTPYVPVAEKIKECNAHIGITPGFTVIERKIEEVNGQWFYTIWIEITGRKFVGTAKIRFDSTSGADEDDEIENAETSALGRALSMAGYGNVNNASLASSEDMQRFLEVEKKTSEKKASQPASEKQIKFVRKLLNDTGMDQEARKKYVTDILGVEVPSLDKINKSQASKLIDSINTDYPSK